MSTSTSGGACAKDGGNTREQLLDAAERLFLESSIDEVSLRAIVRAAGQKNQSALQYHFGGRGGLINAMLERRMAQLEVRRAELLDELPVRTETVGIRELCAQLVRAPFSLCREDASFRAFLGAFGQRLLASERDLLETAGRQELPALSLFLPKLLALPEPLSQELLRLRAENAFGLVLLAMSRRARSGASFRGRRSELFFNNLVDQVAAMLTAPIAQETQAFSNPSGR